MDAGARALAFLFHLTCLDVNVVRMLQHLHQVLAAALGTSRIIKSTRNEALEASDWTGCKSDIGSVFDTTVDSIKFLPLPSAC